MNNNRVLVISYHFPPHGGVENFRVSKIIKYLPENGWDPVVFTLDEARRSELSRGETSSSYSEDVLNNTLEICSTDYAFSPRIGNYIGELGWLPGKTHRLLEVIKKFDIDVVFHTGNPFLPFLAAPLVKALTDVPYVVDLRDPWFISKQYYNQHNESNEVLRYLHQISEDIVFKSVDIVITNTGKMEEVYKSHYPDIPNKFTTIYNGFDPDDYDDSAVEETDAFRIAYPGKFYGQVGPFVEAFSRFVDTTNQRVEFVHMGSVENDETKEFYDLVREYNLQSNLLSKGYTEFQDVVPILKSSNVGVAITRENDITHIPMKVFDYLGCNLSILGVDSKDGQLASLLSSIDYTHIVDHGDSNAIYQALTQCRQYDSEVERGDTIRKYSCQNQTWNLTGVLESTISE